MTAVPLENYLEGEYLEGPPGYLAGTFGELTGMQTEMKIEGNTSPQGMQSEMFVNTTPDTGMQTEMKILEEVITGMQTLAKIVDDADDEFLGVQVDMAVIDSRLTGMQTTIGKLFHAFHEKYLIASEPYLTEAYLTYKRCAFLGMQVEAKIVDETDDRFEGMQVDLKIEGNTSVDGMQAIMTVLDEEPIGMQVNMIKQFLSGMQINFLIYNTTQLRILCDFDSRGIDNTYNGVDGGDNANWLSLQTLAADDLGKLGNLNTDVLEQRVQTADTVTALWELRCDTGSPTTFIDTLYIGEHNFTKSASIEVQGSDDPNFGSVKFSFNVEVNNGFDEVNAYYIAQDPPTISARFIRLLISDPDNPDGHLRIGVIAFGSAQIFTPAETFDNPATFGFRHFKDSIETEGFSNNSNDRATRKQLSLNFTNLKLQGGNFALLRDYMNAAKTDLKCVIIPYPERAAALAVFSKLVSLPQETHNASEISEGDPSKDEWRVSLALDWDESL